MPVHRFRDGGTGRGPRSNPPSLSSPLSRLVTALPGPLLVLDERQCVLHASRAAEELFGVPPEALCGRPARDLFPDGPDASPARLRRVDGGSRRISVTRGELEEDGQFLTLLWLEEPAPEEAPESTLESEKQAASEARSTFVASVSHELRTPMSAILGLTEILLDGSLDPGQRDLVQRVHRASEHLVGTLEDVLDLTRIEAGQLQLRPRPFRLQPWLEEIVALFRPDTTGKDLVLESRIRPGTPSTVTGDPARLRQVLVNLIGNAIKFTDRGSVCVEVALAAGHLDFSVRDTGIGMDPARIPGAFEPWVQLEPVVDRRRSGSGLGLAITRRLVEDMGGSIEAQSRPGHGSEFRFRVPSRLGPRSVRRPPERSDGAPRSASAAQRRG